MGLEMKQVTIHFDPTTGRRQREVGTATFSRKVKKAEAMLKGFNSRFTGGDREFKEMEIDLDIVSIRGNRVDVAADFVLRDSSGRYDDAYQGFVQLVVLAQVA